MNLNMYHVRVQLLVDAGCVRLLKRFAEALRDSVRANGACPILPNACDSIEATNTTDAVALVRVSVYVPAFSANMVKAYARILRTASRSGAPLPKFTFTTPQVTFPEKVQPISKLKPAASSAPIPRSSDASRIRDVMKVARESRDV